MQGIVVFSFNMIHCIKKACVLFSEYQCFRWLLFVCKTLTPNVLPFFLNKTVVLLHRIKQNY
jgi:hypothetical protein